MMKRASEWLMDMYEHNNVFGLTVLIFMWALSWAVVVGIVYLIVMLIKLL